MNNAQFCLGGSSLQPDNFYCRGYTGNLVHVPSLSFYASADPTSSPVTLSVDPGNPGYVVNAAWNYGPGETQNPNQLGPPDYPPFTEPVVDTFHVDGELKGFFGTFGAGNFTVDVPLVVSPDDGHRTQSGYYAGGVLGQTTVLGARAQGYVVAANGQQNPFSSINPPQQPDGIMVEIAGQTTPITSCSPCVTVGLSAELLGQFWAATPTIGGNDGVVPWAQAGQPFQNPYGDGTGNNASVERGTIFQTTLTPADGTTPAIAETLPALLDTGTPDLSLQTNASPEQIAQVSSNGTEVNTGVVLQVSGVDPTSGDPIQGLPPSQLTLTNNTPPEPNSYDAGLSTSTNTIGLPFFLQNSVMFDLTNQVVGYTPFFVTNAPLMTTANGPLIVDDDNVWLGLAGVVSGAGGVTIDEGGAVQFSATNTYTGLTEVREDASLYLAGIGGIAASSGVLNDGVFDISRAWQPISIQTLAGSGETNLGGQNLILTNAAGIFSGVITDDGVIAGTTGGSLTLAGGFLTLAGDNTYTGPTRVERGNSYRQRRDQIRRLRRSCRRTCRNRIGWVDRCGRVIVSGRHDGIRKRNWYDERRRRSLIGQCHLSCRSQCGRRVRSVGD